MYSGVYDETQDKINLIIFFSIKTYDNLMYQKHVHGP